MRYLSLLTAVLSQSVLADIPINEFSECQKQSTDSVKLSCFTKLQEKYERPPVVNRQPTNQESGNWIITTQKNPMDDSTTVIASVFSSSGHSHLLNEPIIVNIRCQSGKVDLFINWHDYLGSEPFVTTRVGDKKAETRRWRLSTNSQSTFYPGVDVDFIEQFKETSSFVARVTPYNENPVTAVFDISGAEHTVTMIRNECGK